MEPKKLSKASEPKALGSYLAKVATKHAGHDHHAMGSVRTATHLGHKIELETTYSVKVDGKPVNVMLMVGDDGQVHCHSLPNYQFGSALDMVKVLIELFPDDFPLKGRASGKQKPPAAKKHSHRAAPKGKK